MSDEATCKGSYILGTECGHCSRCKAEQRREHRRVEAKNEIIAKLSKSLEERDAAIEVLIEAIEFHHNAWTQDRFDELDTEWPPHFLECQYLCKTLAEARKILGGGE